MKMPTREECHKPDCRKCEAFSGIAQTGSVSSKSESHDLEANQTLTRSSRLRSWVAWRRKHDKPSAPPGWEGDHLETPITRSLDDTPDGYPYLAVFQSSDNNFLLYRGFSYLHARLLSCLQYELGRIEQELDLLDGLEAGFKDKDRLGSQGTDNSCRTPEKMPPGFDRPKTRPEVMKDLKEKLIEYDTVLLRAREMVSLQRPSNRDYRSVKRFFINRKPLVEREWQYLRHKEDIVTLRSGREAAGFDDFVEWCLYKIANGRIVQYIFRTPELKSKTKDETIQLFAPRRFDALVNSLITLTIFVLIVLPVVALWAVTSNSKNSSPLKAVGILVLFTFLFGFAMSLMTGAKRQELFAASAAYCAVLVVFISNFANTSGAAS